VYREAKRSVHFSIGAVDRTVDGRPDIASDDWSQATRGAFDILLDRVFEQFEGTLSHLSIGHRVDQWLAGVSAGERSSFVDFALEGLERARAHRRRPSMLRVGVSLSYEGLMAMDVPEVEELVQASDVVFVSYLPFDDMGRVRGPETVVTDLDDLFERLSEMETEPMQVVLEQVGYPSSERANGSLEKQRQFFDSLFRAVELRRERISFVSVFSIDDLSMDVCEAAASAQGLTNGGNRFERFSAGYCSLGLRGIDTESNTSNDTPADDDAPAGPEFDPLLRTPKPAWRRVLEAFAAFQSP
jgi:hypothetical protein